MIDFCVKANPTTMKALNLPTRIMLKVARGYAFVPISDILYFKAADKYAELHLCGGSHYMVFHSMRQLEGKICGASILGCTFIRLHRQYIVAMHHAERLSEQLQLRLTSGHELPVSRQGMKLLKAKWASIHTIQQPLNAENGSFAKI